MSDLKEKIVDDLYRYVAYSLFFALFFSAFTLYRMLVLEPYQIGALHYGYNIVEALILAKILMLGQMLGLGEHYKNRPLIIPTLYKTVVFTLFVFLFSILEHFVVGFLRGRNSAEIYQELTDHGIYEILARTLIMVFVFFLFFAFQETGRVMGENKLFNLFFKGKLK